MLQEVHCSEDTMALWQAEWGLNSIFSNFSSQSVGVGILFNSNFDFEILKQYVDPLGRFILVDIKIENKIITLVNVYAQNQDEPEFFAKIVDFLMDFNCEEIIFGGDFNLVLNLEKDKRGGKQTTNFRSREKVFSLMQNMDLIDVWREIHPDVSRYTWRQRQPAD